MIWETTNRSETPSIQEDKRKNRAGCVAQRNRLIEITFRKGSKICDYEETTGLLDEKQDLRPNSSTRRICFRSATAMHRSVAQACDLNERCSMPEMSRIPPYQRTCTILSTLTRGECGRHTPRRTPKEVGCWGQDYIVTEEIT
jgi:hypothetical protein